MRDPRALMLAASAFLVAGAAALWSQKARAAAVAYLPADDGGAVDAGQVDGGTVDWAALLLGSAKTVIQNAANSAAQTADAAIAAALNPAAMSQEGIDFLKRRETFSATKYPDAAGFSIGYGHFIKLGEVFPASITMERGEQLLRADIATAERAVNSGVKVAVTQAQFDALVSLAYNIGADAFLRSTLLRLLNARDYEGAAAQFAVWNKSQGRTLSALVDRRGLEKDLFAGGAYA